MAKKTFIGNKFNFKKNSAKYAKSVTNKPSKKVSRKLGKKK